MSRDLTVKSSIISADLPLESVILLIAGIMMLVTGALLFPVSAGALPYYENGLYGAFLVMVALQIITLGKSPYGEFPRSRFSLAAGVAVAAAGIVTCFIPGLLGPLPPVLIILFLGPGGFLQLLTMCFAREKLQAWVRYGGIFRHLIFACSAVYGMSMIMALLICRQGFLKTPMTAAAFLIYGAALAYLAMVLRIIYRMHPEAERPRGDDGQLSIDQALLLLTSVFMLLLGALLIPVSLGLLPFSGSAQLGLLMMLFAVQMCASGNTPVGPFPRSWPVICLGILSAALGTVSCIIPEILVPHLTVLVGLLNIIGGVASLGKMAVSRLRHSEAPGGPLSKVLTKLFAAQVAVNLLTVLFGISMLVSSLIPGLVIGVILAANGCVLLHLLHLMMLLDRMQDASRAPIES